MSGYHKMYWALRKQGVSPREAKRRVKEHFRGKKR